ncbi:hypothetical protein C8Q77DRAFT_167671 [Trametes polyzona]|nr:hypothetical protein C8Q77DRAFT_167671 [Trametes polyzona]
MPSSCPLHTVMPTVSRRASCDCDFRVVVTPGSSDSLLSSSSTLCVLRWGCRWRWTPSMTHRTPRTLPCMWNTASSYMTCTARRRHDAAKLEKYLRSLCTVCVYALSMGNVLVDVSSLCIPFSIALPHTHNHLGPSRSRIVHLRKVDVKGQLYYVILTTPIDHLLGGSRPPNPMSTCSNRACYQLPSGLPDERVQNHHFPVSHQSTSVGVHGRSPSKPRCESPQVNAVEFGNLKHLYPRTGT